MNTLMTRYVALLRGINVGGKNPIKMPALKACFEDAGLRGRRHLHPERQRGVRLAETRPAGLVSGSRRCSPRRFDYEASVAVRNRDQMRAVVERAPKGFGADPAKYRSDVIFLKPPLTAQGRDEERPHQGRRRPGATQGPACSTSRDSRAGRPRASSAGSWRCPSTKA